MLNRFSFRYAHVALPLLAGLFTHGCKPYGTHTREHSGNKAKAIHGADSAKSTIQKKLQPGIDRANVHRPIVGEPGQNVYGHVLTEMVRLGQHVNGVTDNPSPPLTGLQKALVIGIGYLHDDSDKNDLHGTLNDAAGDHPTQAGGSGLDGHHTFARPGQRGTRHKTEHCESDESFGAWRGAR